MLNGNRRYGSTGVLLASGNRALEAQECGGIEIGKPVETFFIHPPDEGAQVIEVLEHRACALWET